MRKSPFGAGTIALLALGVLIIIGSVAGYFLTQDTTPAPPQRPEAADAAWTLKFSDDFDGAAVDDKKWSTCYWFGIIVDGQLRCVLGDAPMGVSEPDNVTVKNGTALLELARERRALEGKDYEYTFSTLSSFDRFTFQYGYAEIRAKVPAGAGNWPAFWMMPVSKQWPPEIDVFEFLGREPTVVHGTMHYNDADGKYQQNGGQTSGPDLTQDFHLYAVRWTPAEIVWYLDGKPYHRVTEFVPNEPMYLLVTHGIGQPDSWGGPLDPSTPLPNFLVVDYVRVWGQ